MGAGHMLIDTGVDILSLGLWRYSLPRVGTYAEVTRNGVSMLHRSRAVSSHAVLSANRLTGISIHREPIAAFCGLSRSHAVGGLPETNRGRRRVPICGNETVAAHDPDFNHTQKDAIAEAAALYPGLH